MKLNWNHCAVFAKEIISSFLKDLNMYDHKTIIFLGANMLDCIITYLALQQGTQFRELNAIIHALMNLVGTGYALLCKMIFCIIILWILRKINKEKLIMPLSVMLIFVSLFNSTMLSVYGN